MLCVSVPHKLALSFHMLKNGVWLCSLPFAGHIPTFWSLTAWGRDEERNRELRGFLTLHRLFPSSGVFCVDFLFYSMLNELLIFEKPCSYKDCYKCECWLFACEPSFSLTGSSLSFDDVANWHLFTKSNPHGTRGLYRAFPPFPISRFPSAAQVSVMMM